MSSLPAPPDASPSSAALADPATFESTSPPSRASAPPSRAPGYQPVKVGEGSAGRRSAKACLYCRKGKARCDGLDSYPCRRCREAGVECVFEGLTAEELKARVERKQVEQRRASGLPDPPPLPAPTAPALAPDYSALEARLEHMERELDRVKGRAERSEGRLDRLEGEERTRSSELSQSDESPATTAGARRVSAAIRFEAQAREAFDLFWEMYSPLAPYIDPATDTFDNLRDRSPLLLACIVSATSRQNEDRDFVDYYRNLALRLIRETLYPDKPPTLDDLKGTVVWNAWLAKGSPPGHSVALALQLDLPKALERLLASIAGPPEAAAKAFNESMPGIRAYLTLYTQDLWLSFAMGRRPLVTIDLSVTSARLLLNFGLRPVDARIIAYSELVTILGVVQESFLKTERQSAQTVHIVQQANTHLDVWIKTWSVWADSQDAASGRYMLASFSVGLQAARFYANTLCLSDITTAEQLLPMHLSCLKTALDAAVRIQGIHPRSKIAHSAEFTLISLSATALFLLKMIKLAPHAFSPIHCASYPSFATLASTPSTLPYDATASSPDTSASPLSISVPSIQQALDAARHSAKLLAHAPGKTYAQAVEAALVKLEGELASVPSPASAFSLTSNGASGLNGVLGKRPRDAADPGGANDGPAPPPQPAFLVPASIAQLGSSPQHPPAAAVQDTPGALSNGLDLWAAGAGGGAADGAASGDDVELNELTIAALIGTDSFWSWGSTLPGESIQPFIS
ncbi:hypothetical protein JCM10207_003335 [Rhodosporidiobolus poonsookiae]